MVICKLIVIVLLLVIVQNNEKCVYLVVLLFIHLFLGPYNLCPTTDIKNFISTILIIHLEDCMAGWRIILKF